MLSVWTWLKFRTESARERNWVQSKLCAMLMPREIVLWRLEREISGERSWNTGGGRWWSMKIISEIFCEGWKTQCLLMKLIILAFFCSWSKQRERWRQEDQRYPPHTWTSRVLNTIKRLSSCISRAVIIHPDDVCVRVLRGRSRVRCGQYEEALQDAEFVLTNLQEPENPGALIVQANALYAMGDFEHSLVSFHRALKHEAILMSEKEEIQVGENHKRNRQIESKKNKNQNQNLI